VVFSVLRCRSGSEFVRSIVFGAMDGIMTTFAHVAAVAGSDIPSQVCVFAALPSPLRFVCVCILHSIIHGS
jgi:hypothetical protein